MASDYNLFERRPVVLKGDHGVGQNSSSFQNMLDTTFERLREKHIQYSIRRIREMDEELALMEMELDRFVLLRSE
ncbi:MAG: hypothetical protein FWH19_05200 [Treponema sp.]|nr:hypothetical protein [Treponema sp.]